MNIDVENEIIIDDIPSVNRKTREPSPVFQLAKYIDECIERGIPATGAQVAFKLSELAGGDDIYINHASTLIRNVSLRLYPIK